MNPDDARGHAKEMGGGMSRSKCGMLEMVGYARLIGACQEGGGQVINKGLFRENEEGEHCTGKWEACKEDGRHEK